MDRRRFHIVATYMIGSVMAAFTGVLGFIYLLFPPKARTEQEWTEAADLDSLPEGVPQEVVYTRSRTDGWKVTVEKTKAWLLRKPGGSVVAYAPQCTHLGCAYRWDAKAGNFLCPCHSTRFSVEGKVLSGPAPRPLDQLRVKLEAGKVNLGPIIKIEKGRKA